MALLDRVASWLGLRDDTDTTTESRSDDTASEGPKLDPDKATETRGRTTESAVEALKQTRQEASDEDTVDK